MASRRVTLVTDELLGYVRTGGIGTATSFLALALARAGNEVDVLYAGPEPSTPPAPEWLDRYRDAGVAIRHLARSPERVDPPYFAQMRDVADALRESPADVVVAQDLAAPAYVALRLRTLGLAFENTLFVVNCHGTRRWITDMARKVRVLPNAHAVTVLEQASIELADAVVSPSHYLVEWMRGQGWRVSQPFVIPYFSLWTATGETPPRTVPSENGSVRRIAFFGRLEERKGLRAFMHGLDRLDPALLRDVELEFLGRATPGWSPENIEQRLSKSVRESLRAVSFWTDLDQHEALARLSERGTLAVMPSLGETFGNAVRECLDLGIPFLASDTGAVPELVAPEDRERVLFTPTPAGVEDALRRALTSQDALVPAQSAVDEAASAREWERVLELAATRTPARPARETLDVVVLDRGAAHDLRTCFEALAQQTYDEFSVIVATPRPEKLAPEDLPLSPRVVAAGGASWQELRAAGVRAARAPFLLFLHSYEVVEPTFVETLVQAQATSGADIVSCGLTRSHADPRGTLQFFAGEPRGLGALSNGYGTVALLRRSVVEDANAKLLESAGATLKDDGDHDWPLLARSSVSGAQIVSVPLPLVHTRRAPGTAADQDVAVHVAQILEEALPPTLRPLARIASGLQADAAWRRDGTPSLLARLRRKIARSRM